MSLSKQLKSVYTNYHFWIDAFDKIDTNIYDKSCMYDNHKLVMYWITQVKFSYCGAKFIYSYNEYTNINIDIG